MSISSFEAEADVPSSTETLVSRAAAGTFRLPRLIRPLFFFAVVPVVLFAILYSSNIDGPVDLFHEGEVVTPAFEASKGKLPFRDIYLQHGWGVNLLRAKLAFLLFGESLASSRKMLYGINGILLPLAWISAYFFLYSVFRRKIWIIPALLVLGFADVSITDRHLLPFLSLALLLPGIGGSGRAFFFAGALAAAALFYSLDTGIYAIAIGLGFLTLYSFASPSSRLTGRLGRYILGAALGSSPFLLYLLWHGIFDDFLINSFLQIRYQNLTWGIAPPSPGDLLGPFTTATDRNRALYLVIKWYFPVLLYGYSGLMLLPALVSRNLSREDAPMLLALMTGIAFLPSAFGRADEGHLMYAIAPFWILVICYIDQSICFAHSEIERNTSGIPLLWRIRRFGLSRPVMAALLVSFALYFWATCRNGGIVQKKWRLAHWKQTGASGLVPLNERAAGGITVPAAQAQEIRETIEFIASHTGPHEPVFDFSNQGAYYFLAGRTNSTAFCQAAYALPPPLQAQALEQLTMSPPAAVIFRRNAAYRPHERQPLIDDWIRRGYYEAANIGENILLLPSNQ